MANDSILGPAGQELVLLPEVHIERIPDNSKPECKIICDEPKLSKEDSHETRHLKDLLLLHLDLIQQQQELLLAKDRTIKSLRQDKEALKCRLERMERRMSILRHKGGDDVPPSPSAADQGKGKEAPSTAPRLAGSPAQVKTENRGVKRRHTLEPQNLSKRFAANDKSETPRISRKEKNAANRAAREVKKADSSPAGTPVKRHPKRTFSCSSSTSTNPDAESVLPRTFPKSGKHTPHKYKTVTPKTFVTRNNVHTTDEDYFVPTDFTVMPTDISPVKERKEDEEVFVPSFRIKSVPTGYSMEGTENLNDEIYLRRHQKPEHEEKRRKRWDFQRLREEKILEKLQQGRCYKNERQTKKQPDFESFLPDPYEASFIEVCEHVPVSAFGVSLPEIKAQEFSLPWLHSDGKKDEPKKTRHRRL